MVIVFDLDDTLYNEVDFVRSGFKEISSYLGDDLYYDFMWNLFLEEGSGKIFNKLIEKFKIKEDIAKLLEIYRFHIPDIKLSEESIRLLEFAKNYKTALITDGHYITQKNKFLTLGLGKFIEYSVFTDFYHTSKFEEKPFIMVMKYFKNEDKFIYIADNPKKDFIVPKKLKWYTIRYKNPYGIYKSYPNNANIEVDSLEKIISILEEIK